MDNQSFGQRLAMYRTEKGMLQKELAELIGILPNALSRYENDIREPDVLIIKKLAKALGVTGDDLLGIEQRGVTIKLNSIENKLIENYRQLNEEGQEKAFEYIEDLVLAGRYIKRMAHTEFGKEA